MDKKNLNDVNNFRMFHIKNLPHIKQYYKCRKIHGEVLNSMEKYILDNKFDLNYELNKITNNLLKETNNNYDLFTFDFDLSNEFELNIFNDITIYKSHPNMNCVIEEYISKNKFKNEDKIKMLEAMNKSFVSFFKILKKDYDGFIELKDMITQNTYKVIDISLSNPMYKGNVYLYSRLITVDDISFLSGLMMFPTNNKKVNNYIKTCKYRNKSKFVQLLEVYNLNKEYGIKFRINKIK